MRFWRHKENPKLNDIHEDVKEIKEDVKEVKDRQEELEHRLEPIERKVGLYRAVRNARRQSVPTPRSSK